MPSLVFGRLELRDQFGDRGILPRDVRQNQLDVAVDDLLGDLGRVVDGNNQCETGMGLVKADQVWVAGMARCRLASLDLKTSTIKTREHAHRKLDCFRAIDQGARLVEQKLPSFGHDNAAFHTI